MHGTLRKFENKKKLKPSLFDLLPLLSLLYSINFGGVDIWYKTASLKVKKLNLKKIKLSTINFFFSFYKLFFTLK